MRDVAVLDFPDRKRGIGLYAFVEADPGVSEDALRDALVAALGADKLPEFIQIVEALPRRPEGTVRRDVLRLISTNQVDMIEPLLTSPEEARLVERIVAKRKNLFGAPAIAAALASHPDVRDAAVLVYPDRLAGTGLYAFVETKTAGRRGASCRTSSPRRSAGTTRRNSSRSCPTLPRNAGGRVRTRHPPARRHQSGRQHRSPDHLGCRAARRRRDSQRAPQYARPVRAVRDRAIRILLTRRGHRRAARQIAHWRRHCGTSTGMNGSLAARSSLASSGGTTAAARKAGAQRSGIAAAAPSEMPEGRAGMGAQFGERRLQRPRIPAGFHILARDAVTFQQFQRHEHLAPRYVQRKAAQAVRHRAGDPGGTWQAAAPGAASPARIRAPSVINAASVSRP